MDTKDLKKMKKSLAEAEGFIELLKNDKFWLAADGGDEAWTHIPNVVNKRTQKMYVPVFTSPKEFGDRFLEKYGMIETDLEDIKKNLMEGCDGIVVNPFTDEVIIPEKFLRS